MSKIEEGDRVRAVKESINDGLYEPGDKGTVIYVDRALDFARVDFDGGNTDRVFGHDRYTPAHLSYFEKIEEDESMEFEEGDRVTLDPAAEDTWLHTHEGPGTIYEVRPAYRWHGEEEEEWSGLVSIEFDNGEHNSFPPKFVQHIEEDEPVDQSNDIPSDIWVEAENKSLLVALQEEAEKLGFNFPGLLDHNFAGRAANYPTLHIHLNYHHNLPGYFSPPYIIGDRKREDQGPSFILPEDWETVMDLFNAVVEMDDEPEPIEVAGFEVEFHEDGVVEIGCESFSQNYIEAVETLLADSRLDEMRFGEVSLDSDELNEIIQRWKEKRS